MIGTRADTDDVFDYLKGGVENVNLEIKAAGGYWPWQHQRWEKELLVGQATPGEDTLRMAADHLRPRLVFRWWRDRQITRDQLCEWLPDIWQKCDWPVYSPLKCLSQLEWIELYEETGFLSDDPHLNQPTTDLTVFRGCTAVNVHGMSWTTSLKTATFFAEDYYPARFGAKVEDTSIVTATIPPRAVLPTAVLARWGGRQESEVIVDPGVFYQGIVQVEEVS